MSSVPKRDDAIYLSNSFLSKYFLPSFAKSTNPFSINIGSLSSTDFLSRYAYVSES